MNIESSLAPDPHPVDRQTKAICRDAWRVFRLAQFLEMAPTKCMSFPILEHRRRCLDG